MMKGMIKQETNNFLLNSLLDFFKDFTKGYLNVIITSSANNVVQKEIFTRIVTYIVAP